MSDHKATMVCARNYLTTEHQDRPFGLIIAHTLIVVSIVIVGIMIFKFSRKLQKFLIRERAPKLALFQLAAFGMTLLVPYVVEIIVWSGEEWPASESNQVSYLRRFFKSLYSVCRMMCYLSFVAR